MYRTTSLLALLALVVACENVDTKTTVLAENVLYENKTTSALESATVQDALEELSLNLGEVLIGQWQTQCWDTTTTDIESPGEGHLNINALDDVTHTGVSCLARDGSGTGWSEVDLLRPVGNRALVMTYTYSTGTAMQTHLIVELTEDRIVLTTQNNGLEILTRISP